MKFTFVLKLDQGGELAGVETNLTELVINGVVVVSNGNVNTTAVEEIMSLRGMDNLQLPNGDLN
tara:strand:+ start:264 stop:455 length:192 start_codon:yes stop_codon:yes gene_type:complete